MKIDEAINKCRDLAYGDIDAFEAYHVEGFRDAEYEQLAEWLEELRKGRNETLVATFTLSKEDMQEIVDKKVKGIELDIQAIRNQAIDDFVEAVRRKFPDDRNAITNLEIIAEQLKEGGSNG